MTNTHLNLIIYHYPQSIMTTLSLSLVGLGDQATEVEKEREGREMERRWRGQWEGSE
jgi:hypothetical protein